MEIENQKQDIEKNSANWQAERMYSEEDLKEAFEAGKEMNNNHTWVYSKFEDWFKQFKKK